MPPLNHEHTDVKKAGKVYTVSVTEQNTGPDGEQTFDKDTHYLDSFESAVRIAMREIGDNCKYREMGTGMMYFYEPHGDGEKYRQAVVCTRQMHTVT
jgi:hypothetical protein